MSKFYSNVEIKGTLAMNSTKITSLANGTANTDAVNKGQMDAAITAALVGTLEYRGSYDASTEPGSPDLTAAAVEKGWFYLVTVAGSLNGVALDVGDHIVFSADVAATTAPTSSDWDKIDNTEAVADASGITYTPAALANWNGSADPGEVDDALDQLASRVAANESAIAAKADSSTVTEIDGNVDDLITLSGVAENATDLGTFTGTTIADASTIKGALQALETAVEAVSDDQTAAEVSYNNATSSLTATNVQAAIDEVEGRLDTAESNISSNTSAIATKADSSVVTEIDGNVDDLISLSGVAENSSNLGTFTGSTISDSATVKGALQELETSLETKADASALPQYHTALIGANTSEVINHGFGLTDPKRVHVQMYDASSGEPVFGSGITFTDGNNLTISFISAPGASAVKLVITSAE